jgi:hypothetical protein
MAPAFAGPDRLIRGSAIAEALNELLRPPLDPIKYPGYVTVL